METTNETCQSQVWLQNLLQEKTKHNSQFSLRAFARLVDVSPAVLSRILNGKRKLTFAMAVRIADALKLGPIERETLYSFYVSDKGQTKEDRADKELTIDCFTAMKEWYHYGITQLMLTENFREDHKWMSKILGVGELEIKLAIDRLIRLEVLDRDEEGKLFKTSFLLNTTPEVASSGLRHFQKQILEKSINSLEHDSSEEKDITSITIAINEDRLAEAKKEIKKFRMKMSEFLTEGKKTRVYNLGIHLVPLSKSTIEK